MAYRILTLDGGGTWALIQVKALIELYGAGARGNKVLRDFDMAAATSGGSIVLGALLEDLSLAEILEFFEDQAKRLSVFSPTSSFGDRILHEFTGLGPKYSSDNKLAALKNVLPTRGALPLAGITAGLRRPGAQDDLHLLITGFDYDRNRATFFRSSPTTHPGWGRGDEANVTLAEAIHASTNAPVNYFDAPAAFPNRAGRYWDGAISGCNNPVLAAVTEAIVKNRGVPDLAALSIGTGSVALPWASSADASSPYVRQICDSGLVTDLRKLALSVLDDPPDIATFLAHVMTGGGAGLNTQAADSRIVRMSPLVSPVGSAGAWTAPGAMTAEQFSYLAKLDMDAVEQIQVDAISRYADLWVQGVAPNQPVRMDGDTLKKELGQDRFPAAVHAWNAIR
ncbi:MAG: patatin-like phospholipase family protein [Acidobacteriota bacterium]|nr:patatin-like phospholipase family protein [Acidobacteriota bacterium]